MSVRRTSLLTLPQRRYGICLSAGGDGGNSLRLLAFPFPSPVPLPITALIILTSGEGKGVIEIRAPLSPRVPLLPCSAPKSSVGRPTGPPPTLHHRRGASTHLHPAPALPQGSLVWLPRAVCWSDASRAFLQAVLAAGGAGRAVPTLLTRNRSFV